MCNTNITCVVSYQLAIALVAEFETYVLEGKGGCIDLKLISVID